MPDREKVIQRLNHLERYGAFSEDWKQALRDAIALLREQEPVVPENHMPDETCPACGAAFIGELSYYLGHTYKKYYAYCPGCGRKVKWDG